MNGNVKKNVKNDVTNTEYEEFENVAPTLQQQQESSSTSKKPVNDNTVYGFFERIVIGIKRHPMAFVLLFVILLKNYLSMGKTEHIEGSLVRHINTSSEWNDLMDESKKEGKIVLVDFFATW